MTDAPMNPPEDDESTNPDRNGNKVASLLKLYREGKVPGDLIKFFAGDFFHDGEIRSIKFIHNLKRVELEISCPNIQRGEEFVKPIWFRCVFDDVCKFSMETEKIDEFNDPLLDASDKNIFLECEVHGFTDDINKFSSMYAMEFSSIVIKTLPSSRVIGWLFSSVRVEPFEPCAFEILRFDKKFVIPLVEL